MWSRGWIQPSAVLLQSLLGNFYLLFLLSLFKLWPFQLWQVLPKVSKGTGCTFAAKGGGGERASTTTPPSPSSLKFPFCKPLKKIPPQPCILEWAPSWLYSILQSGCREPDTSQSPPTLISRLTVIRVRIVKEQAPYVLITGGATHWVPECRLYWSESRQQQRKEKMLTSEAERYSLTRYFGCQFHWLDSQLQRQEKMLT